MELAGRDQVARSIMTEVLEGRGSPDGGAYLSIAHLPKSIVEFRLESMIEQFEDAGIDIREEPMQVSPTAHHFMGGIKTDEDAGTIIPGLFASGECTGGLHGGNRLGGNALADTQVYGAISGESAAKYAKSVFLIAVPIGILIIILGALMFGLDFVGAGLMGGGVGVILYGVGGFWQFAEDWIKFLLSLVGLVILIWFAYWFDKRSFKKKSKGRKK